MLSIINELLANKKIPTLDGNQMPVLLHYLFNRIKVPLRIETAEVVYRYDRDHPSALDVYLACTLPLARRAALGKASRIFIHPSDWQIELMYDGAVTAAINIFQQNFAIPTGFFRRYLLRALALGCVRSYFMRQENDGVRPVENLAKAAAHQKLFRNSIEHDIIIRDLLDQVTNFPQLRAPVLATLQCIAALGPHRAIKDHAYTESGDSHKWKRARRQRPILDPDAIAEAMGIPKQDVHRYLCQARVILREAFNADGKLFLNH